MNETSYSLQSRPETSPSNKEGHCQRDYLCESISYQRSPF